MNLPHTHILLGFRRWVGLPNSLEPGVVQEAVHVYVCGGFLMVLNKSVLCSFPLFVSLDNSILDRGQDQDLACSMESSRSWSLGRQGVLVHTDRPG